ncbi:MAG: AAA+ ATPase superfamily predicted ATPase [Verrucomicrobiales bacterium]|jgi:AAA+ ATPase superfamily predicted ATPase
MKKPFLGRERESHEFQQLLDRTDATLVTCQGRRRIGKSRFIHTCAKKADHFYAFMGLPPREGITKQSQLDAFSEQIADQTKAPRVPLDSWYTAFRLLDSQLPGKGKIVILLDEISWLAIGDPDFSGHLKTAWDTLFSHHSRLMLVLCGSVSSWIEKNVLNNTGFVGRCTWQFKLAPLPLPKCHEFWGRRKSRVSSAEKLRMLAVTGGVPRYLEEIDPKLSAEQNIEKLCFNSSGLLFNEFNQIFHDIFNRKAPAYREIVRALVTGRGSVSKLSKSLKRIRGGTLSSALTELEQSGFIRKDVSFDPETAKPRPRAVRYRLSDNYLRFYLRYIEPVRSQIESGLYQQAPVETFRAWDTIMGLQFENLILENLPAMLAIAGLDKTPMLNAGPFYQAATKRKKGCQIDLMLRSRQSLYIFEIKFRKRIQKSVIGDVQRKVDNLSPSRSLAIRTGLIYEGTLDSEIEKSDYFDYLIPFDAFLK